ncbi:hypothetical protein B296_00042212, partial [Ensete ventricosum]
LAHGRLSEKGGARLDGRSPRIRLGRSVAGVVELESGKSVSPRVGRRILQEGRVGWGSRRDLSDGQVSLVVDFAIPLLRRGAGAFIVTIVGCSYLRPLSSSLLTILSHLIMSSMVLVVRRAPSSLQLGDVDLAHLTLVRSAVRRLTLLCLCQAGSNTSGRPRRRACCPRARGHGNQVNIHHIIPLPSEKTLRFLIRVPKMRSCNEPLDCSEVRLVSDPNEHELIRPCRGSRSDPTEQELGN